MVIPYWQTDDKDTCKIYLGDSVEVLEQLRTKLEGKIQCCITSPPYWSLRNYKGGDLELGSELIPDCRIDNSGSNCNECYVCRLVNVFRGVKELLTEDGTLWLNIGDTYNTPSVNRNGKLDTGLYSHTKFSIAEFRKQNHGVINKGVRSLPKGTLLGIPWRVVFALQSDGWILRNDIIWKKPNCMPDGATNRWTKEHEYLFLFAKNLKYYCDTEKVKDNRNPRTVWNIPVARNKGIHRAVFPAKLIEPCVVCCSTINDIILDPFIGSGTTAIVALKHKRRCIGIDLSEDYLRVDCIPKIRSAVESIT